MKIILMFFYTGYLFLCFNLKAGSQVAIGNSTQLVSAGNIQMVLTDLSFINNGGFIPATGSVMFNGVANNIISGSSVTAFHHLLLNKTTGNLLLQRNIDVNGNIVFTSGLLDLNSFNIILSPSSLLNNENENARITGLNGGYLQITASLDAPILSNPGNLGAMITSTKNLGSTLIRRGHEMQTGSGLNSGSIHRYYDIIPSDNNVPNAGLKFNYFNAELNGKNEKDLWLWRSDDLTTWFASPATDQRDSILNFVSGKGINSFSRWTLSSASFPQGSFGACEGTSVLKIWPNPFSTDFNIGIKSSKTTSATLVLFDMKGKHIASKPLDLKIGSNLYNFNFPELPSGAYIVKITESGCSTSVAEVIKINR